MIFFEKGTYLALVPDGFTLGQLGIGTFDQKYVSKPYFVETLAPYHVRQVAFGFQHCIVLAHRPLLIFTPRFEYVSTTVNY